MTDSKLYRAIIFQVRFAEPKLQSYVRGVVGKLRQGIWGNSRERGWHGISPCIV